MRAMAIEIRPYTESDLAPWWDVLARTFGEEVRPEEADAWLRMLARDRMLGAMEGDRLVGTAALIPFQLTIPGGQVGAAGVTAVAVLATHRRRGILRQMMERQLRDVREAGEPVAILWASEGPIYQRFGYGLATLSGTVELPRTRSAFRVPVVPEGGIRLIEHDEAARLLPPVYEQLRRTTPGFFDRGEAWWETEVLWDPEWRRRGAGPKQLVVHEVDGAAEGYAIYRLHAAWGDQGPDGKLEVREVMATTPRATRELWRYLFDVDLMTRTRAVTLPPDPPVLMLVADPRALALHVGDGLWLRIVDVPGALEPRSYRGSGTLVMELADPILEETAGRWELAVQDGRARVTRTSRDPDLTLSVADLAAMYLGQFGATELARAGRVVEHRPGALDQADTSFATGTRPWCPQLF
jgi:predicted acetyltransferase